jgi:hypothetical protein
MASELTIPIYDGLVPTGATRNQEIDNTRIEQTVFTNKKRKYTIDKQSRRMSWPYHCEVLEDEMLALNVLALPTNFLAKYGSVKRRVKHRAVRRAESSATTINKCCQLGRNPGILNTTQRLIFICCQFIYCAHLIKILMSCGFKLCAEKARVVDSAFQRDI